MSEYTYARIQIGGPLREDFVDDFTETVYVTDGGSIDNLDVEDDTLFESIKSSIEAAASSNIPYVYDNDEAYDGRFPAIEQFCQNSGLTYRLYCSGGLDFYSDYPRVIISEPGCNLKELAAFSSENPLMSLVELKDKMKQGYNLEEVINELKSTMHIPALSIIPAYTGQKTLELQEVDQNEVPV